MATGIFCTVAEVQRKVGANASATANVEAFIDQFTAEAESYINTASGKNWSDLYATLNVDFKNILKEAASNLAAIYVINYDLSGFPLLLEAQTRIDVLRDSALRCIELLKDQDRINKVENG